MEYQTHFAAGAASGAALLYFTGAPISAVVPVLAISAISGLLPDIDHGNSIINKLTGIGGTIVAKVVSHRTATHSLLAAAAFSMGLLALRVPELYALAAIIGLLSHLVVDSLNPQGIPWLWPVMPQKVGFPLITTGGIGEKYIARPASYVLMAYFLGKYFGVL